MRTVSCRFCRSTRGEIVLDLGEQPAGDHFPAADDPGPDPVYPLRMWLCAECGLAQLAEDPTAAEEPLGQEPAALVEQAAAAVEQVAAAGFLPPVGTVAEYGSPHGGSWLGLLTRRGLVPAAPRERADVVVDCFGLMHEPDQAAGLARRVERMRPGGVLILQFHSLAAIVRGAQWNALRHAHFAYYSTPVLVDMLDTVGLSVRTVRRFPLYGGTNLLVITRDGLPDEAVRELSAQELAEGMLRTEVVAGLQRAAAEASSGLAAWVAEQRAAGRQVLGYSAASRSVALLCSAGLTGDLLPAVADASPAKQGRRLPGSGIPVITPDELVSRRPDSVLLFVPDLLPEVRRTLPQIEASGGRWIPVEGPSRR